VKCLSCIRPLRPNLTFRNPRCLTSSNPMERRRRSYTGLQITQGTHRPNKQGKLPPPIANKPATIRRPIAKTTGEETPGSTIEARDDPPPLTQVRQMEMDPDRSDYPNKNVYWIDSHIKSIECMAYDGKLRYTIMQGQTNLGHPWRMQLFQV
jgi:hypothetical protein